MRSFFRLDDGVRARRARRARGNGRSLVYKSVSALASLSFSSFFTARSDQVVCLGPATKYCFIGPIGDVPSIKGLVSGSAETVS